MPHAWASPASASSPGVACCWWDRCEASRGCDRPARPLLRQAGADQGADLALGDRRVLLEHALPEALLVASRVVEFYTLLGNEAFSDAQDPTIGLTTSNNGFGFDSLAPTIFTFQNQLSSVLEEELTLLRGRDDTQGLVQGAPVYNRLFWNFPTGRPYACRSSP